MAAQFNGVTAIVAAQFDDVAAVLVGELDGMTTIMAAEFDDVAAVLVGELHSVAAVLVGLDRERAERGRFSMGRAGCLESDEPSEAQCPQNEQRRSQRCIHWFLLNQVCRSVEVC